MRVYETTFIVNPQTDDATIDQRVSSVTDLITSNGGKVLGEDRMGTRRLAYPIQKLTQGYYHTLIYEAPGEFVQELDRFFRLNESYLRHLTILFEGKLEDLKSRSEDESPREQKPAADEGKTAEKADDSEKSEEKAEEKPADDEPDEVVVAQSVTPEAAEESGDDSSESADESSEDEAKAEDQPEGESEEEEEKKES